MTAIDPKLTVKHRNPRTGRWETTTAYSRCGTWRYTRVDHDTTPWSIQHRPTGTWFDFVSTRLSGARACTAHEPWLCGAAITILVGLAQADADASAAAAAAA
jgi:hypothetical protein